MSKPFDPYHKWLGIRPEHQPPHHYLLLGIPEFEDDPDVIDNAAERQIAHLRRFEKGEHLPDAKRLFTQIREARQCLLDHEQKAAYDTRLRSELPPDESTEVPTAKLVPQPPPLHASTPTSPPRVPSSPPKVTNQTQRSAAAMYVQRRRRQQIMLLMGGVASLTLLLIVVVVVVSSAARDQPRASEQAKKDVDRSRVRLPPARRSSTPAAKTRPRPPNFDARTASTQYDTASPLVVLLKTTDESAVDNHVRAHLKLHNNTDQRIPLGELRLRYWFTAEGSQPQQLHCDWAQLGTQLVSGNFQTLRPPRPGADCYLEVKFDASAPAIMARADSGPIHLRFHKTDWSNYDETNDYSHCPRPADFDPWPRITLYRGTKLVWGTEPSATNDD